MSGIPPAIRGWLGPHAAVDWLALGDEVAVKRDIINTLLEIKVLAAGKGRRTFLPDRVALRWKLTDADAAAIEAAADAEPVERPRR